MDVVVRVCCQRSGEEGGAEVDGDAAGAVYSKAVERSTDYRPGEPDHEQTE